MKRGSAFLLTSDELQFVASASGMSDILLFQPAGSSDRTQKIQTIFKLIRDGFFIQNETSIKVGPNLAPFIKVFRRATNVVVAHPAGTEAPPLCIYCDDIDHEFAVISPHESKSDTYKLGIVDEEALIEDLETLHFLPALYDEFATYETVANEVYQLFNGIDSNCEDYNILAAIGEDLVARFKRYCLAEKSCEESLTVFRAAPSWAMIVRDGEGINLSYYRRSEFASWLEGRQNDKH